MSEHSHNRFGSNNSGNPIRTVLIANRGEIAVRVMRTAKHLGIKTIAVFSAVDKHTPHVEAADVAYPLTGSTAAESYLNQEAIIRAARETGADAIHPGYGFLSENADFAQLCADNNIRFIGPAPDAIRAMGSKSAAKKLMEDSGVPLLPGFHGERQDAEFLSEIADKVGYPVMLKASAGGGGKGMRIVMEKSDFPEALNAVKREALSAFGDDKVLIERYIERPRHIEIQIFGDSQGNYVHLFERDCSIQRRHQKVIEEAPAPQMTAQWREQMGSAAIAAAKAIDYTGAGTVEFIVDQDQQFYFMEMNTRLQVEHPVTEMITGIDLVDWQFRVAAGDALPCAQQDITLSGHSVEARLYAEDTENQFLPSTGALQLLKFPPASDTLRIEAGVRQGNEISIFYDPMMAKIISYGHERSDAIDTLITALESTQILGVANNSSYLCRVLSTQAFRQAELSTAFLEEQASLIDLTKGEAAQTGQVLHTDLALSFAALYLSLRQSTLGQHEQEQVSALHSDGWRLNSGNVFTFNLCGIGTSDISTLQVQQSALNYQVKSNNQIIEFKQPLIKDEMISATLEQHRVGAMILASDSLVSVKMNHQEHRFQIVQSADQISSASTRDRNMLSPMPGKVVQILVQQGEKVEQDQPVMIIEAMKMEHTIRASQSGTVASIFFAQNDPVEANAQLLSIEE